MNVRTITLEPDTTIRKEGEMIVFYSEGDLLPTEVRIPCSVLKAAQKICKN